ncbi:MAG: AbrB/MazE/SpoVT family DNA-binding domain-containing protein [Bryobacterales bacterium]|nr:AbrB/MazE/SpoVT family DNA-binding domain-containing protein [Bryobacterales bacterium]
MGTTVVIDDAGRLELPEKLREQLHLSPGDRLDIAVEGESLTLRRQQSNPFLHREDGVWVLRTGEPLSETDTRELLQGIREGRIR